MERLAARVPLRSAVIPRPTLLRVVGGNDIYTLGGSTWKGIKYSGTPFTSVPTAIPVHPTTYADGLGYGYLQANGFDIGSLVWICNGTLTDTSAVTRSASVLNSVSSDSGSQLVSSSFTALVTCLAGGTASVYIVARSG